MYCKGKGKGCGLYKWWRCCLAGWRHAFTANELGASQVGAEHSLCVYNDWRDATAQSVDTAWTAAVHASTHSTHRRQQTGMQRVLSSPVTVTFGVDQTYYAHLFFFTTFSYVSYAYSIANLIYRIGQFLISSMLQSATLRPSHPTWPVSAPIVCTHHSHINLEYSR